MPAKLKSIELENWKSLKNLQLGFEDINVLIGPNGSGKSNLVQFFYMLNMMMTGSLQLFIGRSGGANSLLHYGSKNSLLIDSKLTFSTETATDTYAFRLIHGAPDTFVFASEKITYKTTDNPRPAITKEFGSGHKESVLNDFRVQQNEVFAFVRGMLSRVRYFQFHDTSNEAHIRSFAREDNNGFLFYNGGNVAAVLLRLRKDFPGSYEEVVERVRESVPAFRDFVLEPDHGQVLLNWVDKHRGQLFGPHQLSDGSIRIIALHTLLALPPQLSPSVAIIDEPELGLFPRAIETLVDAIRSASTRCQIVLATQSNRLVRYLNPDSLICCSWRDGESTVERVSPIEQFEFMDNYTLGDYIERNPR
jgi:predicted ATPase